MSFMCALLRLAAGVAPKSSELFSHFFLLPLVDDDELDDGREEAAATATEPRTAGVAADDWKDFF